MFLESLKIKGRTLKLADFFSLFSQPNIATPQEAVSADSAQNLTPVSSKNISK